MFGDSPGQLEIGNWKLVISFIRSAEGFVRLGPAEAEGANAAFAGDLQSRLGYGPPPLVPSHGGQAKHVALGRCLKIGLGANVRFADQHY